MQRLSYDPKNPRYKIFDVEFSLEIFSYENVYGLDPERCELKFEGDKAILTARGLTLVEAKNGHECFSPSFRWGAML